MIFPLVPYGPYEIIDPSTIDVADEVEVEIAPVVHAANANITPDFVIERADDAGFFFGKSDGQVPGLRISDYYPIEEALREAAQRRFANEDSPRFETTLQGREKRTVVVSLSAYRPRGTPPRTVRLTLREFVPVKHATERIHFGPNLAVLRGRSASWDRASADEKKAVLDLVAKRFENPVEQQTLSLGAQPRQLFFRKAEVRWPFRPTRGHPLGIDGAGRDVLARILYGLRISMTFGLVLVVFSMAAGVAIGAVQGYFGGKIDITAQRLIEIWSTLPFLYIMILMGSVYGRGFVLLLFVYAIFNWIGISYYMRGEFLRLRKQQFVEAAKGVGASSFRIIFRHIFPNALVPVITFFPFSLVGAIGSLAALDYLGFGMPPPTASWGELLNQAQEFRWAWWLILYPSLSLFIVMLLGVFVGEGVRNAFDPRSYNKIV